jgi:uncharacterized phage-associated protein
MTLKEVKISMPDSARASQPRLSIDFDSTESVKDKVALEGAQPRIEPTELEIRVRLSSTLPKEQVNRNAAEEKPNVHDVAACILQHTGELTAMKLQKLVYYCQAWSLVWDEAPLFDEEIQAWANGPVVPALYARHQGLFKICAWNGNPERLTKEQCETILKVLEFYGDMPSQTISELTHREEPWLKARAGLGIGERGNRVITHADMAEYYSSL